MDVFLIPTTTSERYELYYEAPDEEVVDAAEGSGIIHRMKRRFAEMLRDAEEWRHRRHEQAPEPLGILGRLRRKIMSFVVERIAEQRLLWHMRKATDICARIPADLSEADAEVIVRAMLKADTDHHLKWMLIDLALLIPSALLTVIPGPNIIGLYFTFQVVGHFLSWRGGKQGLTRANWTFKPSPDLAELREVMKLAPPQRHRRFRELANRLQLEHLATFLDDVAAPTA
jgi:Mitochondrial K+-H+ exchange-related